MKKKLIMFLLLMSLILSSCASKTDESNSNLDLQEEDQVTIVEPENTEDGKDESVTALNDFGIDFSSYEYEDLEGNKIDGSIFNESKVVLNIWGSFCKPCVVEMPELQKIHENYQGSNVKVIGLLADASMDYRDNIPAALDIVDYTKVEYENIIAPNELIEDLLQYVQGFPTTLFLDENGKQAGKLIIGARDYDFFDTWVNSSI